LWKVIAILLPLEAESQRQDGYYSAEAIALLSSYPATIVRRGRARGACKDSGNAR
jgi:hypothetical protein